MVKLGQGVFLCFLEKPCFIPVGIGECPFFIPEQFTFKDMFGYSGAVDRDIRFVFSGAQGMNGSCSQVFARLMVIFRLAVISITGSVLWRTGVLGVRGSGISRR